MANGGLILSIDGIQPDKGDETIYLVQDVLTGRLLTATNVSSSDTEVMKQMLGLVEALGLPILGVISDAQASLLGAVAALWPQVPHQICQFHYLREVARPITQVDRTMRKEIRKVIQKPVREVREQVGKALEARPAGESQIQQQERAQWQVAADYALGIQTALNLDGVAPFAYPGIQTYEALNDIEASIERLEKKGQS